MIRNRSQDQRCAAASSSRVTRSGNRFGEFEKLEDRNLLAFIASFYGTTLELFQIVDDGDIVVDNNGAGNEFRVVNV